MFETTDPTFPWQLLYNERLALTADLARIDKEISALHYRVDYELKPIRDVLAVRLADVTEAVERYEERRRDLAPDSPTARTLRPGRVRVR